MTSGEFVYRLKGTPGGSRPGAHGSRRDGQGLAFARHGSLLDHPDPRRLDLRASLRSVPREWLVRVNRQRSAVSIEAVVDVSASMHVGGTTPGGKLGVAAQFVASLGRSAFRSGDRAGLSAFDARRRDSLCVTARSARGIGVVMAETLRDYRANDARAGSLDGLAGCADALAGSAALVFIVSDFHWPLEGLTRVLDNFAAARIVPLVLWDPAEIEPPASTGWITLRDAESGRERTLWMRASTRAQWRARVAERRETLDALFAANGIEPLYVSGVFDAEALSRHFMETVG